MSVDTIHFASLVFPIPINSPFTYAIPSDLDDSACVGRRALAPFGKRLLTGFIIGISDTAGNIPKEKIKPLVDIIDDSPVFDSHMLNLATWIAGYYCASVGEILKSAMPHGTMVASRLRIHLNEYVPEHVRLTHHQQEVFEAVQTKKSLLLKTLEHTFGEPVVTIIRSLERKGLVRIEREVTSPAVIQRTELSVKLSGNSIQTLPSRAFKQIQCVEVLRRYPDGIALTELLERYSFSRGIVNSLVEKGIALYEEMETAQRPKILGQEPCKVDYPLTSEQQACVRTIMNEASSPNPKPVLIWGVTGSGKTRVYIEIVRNILKQGKGALVLVPEISLTPQTTRFFSSVFPEQIAVLHSALTPRERHDMWYLIHEGKCNIVIGPRSAVFAPLPSLGVIIVDEEHDTSYKQSDMSPRYNARDVAVVRGHNLNIPVVLGTATPSMESWHNASKNKYVLTTLSERVESRPLPSVVPVDMRKEFTEGNFSSLSRQLRSALVERIDRGEKSIILINRRGFSTHVQCRECGYVLMCPHCTVTLTYHSSKGLAVCHVCGYSQVVSEHCPICGSSDLKYRGRGTQRIEKELSSLLPSQAIVRMDSDTTQAHNAHFRLLEEFRTGKSLLLLGTQMVGKGHDFPEVTLVGIISADSSLYLPDFRSSERTFQLITQVAGRSGRGQMPGMVILQTHTPDNYVIKTAMKQDFSQFAQSELEARREVGFPPFSHLILITLSSSNKIVLDDISKKLALYLAQHAPKSIEIMGPTEAPIPRIKRRHRIHIMIKSPQNIRSQPLVCHAVEHIYHSDVKIDIDVDPMDLL